MTYKEAFIKTKLELDECLDEYLSTEYIQKLDGSKEKYEAYKYMSNFMMNLMKEIDN